jgi:hypothetical protein
MIMYNTTAPLDQPSQSCVEQLAVMQQNLLRVIAAIERAVACL